MGITFSRRSNKLHRHVELLLHPCQSPQSDSFVSAASDGIFLIIYNNSVLRAPALHMRHNLTGAERGTLGRVSASPYSYHFEIIGARRICGYLVLYMNFSLLTCIFNQRTFTPSASFKAGIESTTDSPLDRWNPLHKLSLQSSHFRRIVRTPSA